jgi:hypothetical protein
VRGRRRVDDCGVVVAVVDILTEVAVGTRGRMTALMDRRWKSETGASNFEAGAIERARRGGGSGTWLYRGGWWVVCVCVRNKQIQ